MKHTSNVNRVVVFLIVIAVATVAGADSTVEQLRDQDPNPNDKPTSPDSLTVRPDAELASLLEKYQHLERHLALMSQPDSDDEIAQSLKRLQGRPDTVREVTDLYQALTEKAADDNAYFGEARWRALHLLGALKDPGSAAFLHDIASAPMPDSRTSPEVEYKIEYRLRARAIAGLELLDETDALLKIYNEGGIVSGLAAASLFELGSPPKGVEAVDGRKIVGYGDPRDFNRSRAAAVDGASPKVEVPSRAKEQDQVQPTTPTEQ